MEKRNNWIKGILDTTEIHSKDVLVMIEGKETILVWCMQDDNIHQKYIWQQMQQDDLMSLTPHFTYFS